MHFIFWWRRENLGFAKGRCQRQIRGIEQIIGRTRKEILKLDGMNGTLCLHVTGLNSLSDNSGGLLSLSWD